MKYEPPFSLPAIPREHRMVGVGGFMESQNFVSGTSGWRLTGEGNFEGNDGTFRGNITGATGTFTGSLSGADITGATGAFSGSLSAATGTFAGSLSAASGTFTGALSAATGTFGGSLSAATGTFSGDISGASGTFTGSLSGADITGATGTFAGALSGATGTFAGSLSAASGTFAGSLSAATGTFSGDISGASGTFSGSLSAASGTIGGWTIGSSSLSNSGTSGTATLKSSGASAGLWVSTTDSTTDGYIIINQGTDATYGNHSNLQMLAPAMTGSSRPGITIKHYVDGDSFIDIGTDDSDPQIRLTDRASGVDEMFLNATKIVINSSDADANLYFSTDTNTNINWSDTNTAWTFNNLGTARFSIWAAGAVLNTCDEGTGDSLEINAYGVIVRNTSSERYKNIDTTIDMTQHLSPEMVDNLHPKMWAFKNDTDQHPHISLISEEANEVSPFFVTKSFDDNGDVALSGLKDRAIMSLLVVALQDARARIATLES